MEDNKKAKELMRKIADLLLDEQSKLGLTNFQMSQRLDIPLRTYNRIISGVPLYCQFDTLDKILQNSNITYDDIFEGIYKSKYSRKEI